MTPERRGISRMTNVVSPLEQLGHLSAEAERLKRSPWLRAARWARAAVENQERDFRLAAKSQMANSAPGFLSAVAAVVLVTGAASALSPIGSDLASEAPRQRASASAAVVVSTELPVETASRVTEASEVPVSSSDAAAPGMSPLEQLVSAYATASVIQDARLEPAADVVVNPDVSSPRALVTLAEYRSEPAEVATINSVVLRGLPKGSRVSRGLETAAGEWVLALDDLRIIEIAVPSSIRLPAMAQVEVNGPDGVRTSRFPLVADVDGRVDTRPIAAAMKGPGIESRPAKLASLKVEPQPVRVKPAVKPQKETVAAVAVAPQQKRKTAPPAAVRPVTAPAVIKPTTPVTLYNIEPAEPSAASAPVGLMTEGSAGLETFRSFSLLGGEPPVP